LIVHHFEATFLYPCAACLWHEESDRHLNIQPDAWNWWAEVCYL